MKTLFKLTKEDIAKWHAEHPEAQPKPQKITGNTRDAALREMLIPHFGTKVKVSNATMPKPIQPSTSGVGKEDRS